MEIREDTSCQTWARIRRPRSRGNRQPHLGAEPWPESHEEDDPTRRDSGSGDGGIVTRLPNRLGFLRAASDPTPRGITSFRHGGGPEGKQEHKSGRGCWKPMRLWSSHLSKF
jgi:hypothetical protein